MRITALCLVFVVTGSAFAAGQQEPGAQAPSRGAFKFELQPLCLPGYEPAREVRLALADSPMSRLELAVSREQWALRNPGSTGSIVPLQAAPLPFRFRSGSVGQYLVPGPWSPTWGQLTWQERVAAGAQTAFIAWAVIQIVRYAH